MNKDHRTGPGLGTLSLALAAFALAACATAGAPGGDPGEEGGGGASASDGSAGTGSSLDVDAGIGGSPGPDCNDEPKPLPNAPLLDAIVAPEFAETYTLYDLGPVPGFDGFPQAYAGSVISSADPNTLFIGDWGGALYSIGVERGPCGHIVGFVGTAKAAVQLDGTGQNLVYGPGGVLFFPTPYGEVGQLLPNQSQALSITQVAPPPTQMAGYLMSLDFVPPGLGAAGQLRAHFYVQGPDGTPPSWFHVPYAPASQGFTLSPGVPADDAAVTFQSGGMAYIPVGSTSFPKPSLMMVVAQPAWSAIVLEVDDEGDPMTGTQRDFITGLHYATGSYFERNTGDFLFATTPTQGSETQRLIIVQGFAKPAPTPK